MPMTLASSHVEIRPGTATGGSPWVRSEDRAATSGEPIYATDKVRPGQAALRVVRSTIAHGKIIGIDIAEAKSAPGVIGVYTAADIVRRQGYVPTIPIRIRTRPELDAYAQPVMASDLVRYVGEPVAVVVAESEALAEDAAELVVVDYDPLPVVLEIGDDAAAPNPTQELFPGTGNCLATYDAETGSVDEVFASAAVVVTETFRVERDTSLPLEPRSLLSEWDPQPRRLHLWGPAKYLKFTRNTVADWFGMAPDDVLCHHVRVGGMFGTRGEVYPEEFLVPWAAREVARPVKWTEDRAEHMVSINQSRDTVHRLSLAASADGRLLALDAQIAVNLGAYPRPIGARIAEILAEGMPGPYLWSAYRGTCRAVVSNKTPAGTMRGPGTFDLTFARERLLDILAERIKINPIDLRRKNLIPHELMPYTQPLGSAMHPLLYDSGDYPRGFEALLGAVDLPALEEAVEARRANGELVGIGVACFLDHSGLGMAESIRLDYLSNGRFRFATAGSEVGQGLGSAIARIGSDALGVPVDRVDVVTNDSAVFVEGAGTFSSRSTIFAGSAAYDAAIQLRRKRPDLFADEAMWDPPDASTSATADAVETVIGTHEQAGPTYGFGAHIAVVSIDPSTFRPTVERVCVAYDCGRAIDRESVRTQLEGGTVFGLGGVLYQVITYDPQGQPQSTTLLDFNVPMAAEMPAVQTVILEYPGVTSNPLGVKGVGEAGVMGIGGAVGNAVAAATRRPRSVTLLPIAGTPRFADSLLPREPSAHAGPAERAIAEQVGEEPRSSATTAWWRVAGASLTILIVLRWLARHHRRKAH